MTANSTSAARCPSPLVLFGIDNRGKPKGARFGKEHASLAMKAATQLQLQVLASNDPKVAEIAARLPVGRVHGTGRAFVPFIHRDLYDQLLAAAAANGNARPTSPPNGSSGAQGSTPGGSAPHLLYPRPRPTAETGKSAKASGQAKHDKPVAVNPATNGQSLPKDWDEIDIDHLVLAKDDSRWPAWFEAIVVENAGDLFKLRWRDNASTPPITRPRFDLALICPDAA
jgi:hypothetical protein